MHNRVWQVGKTILLLATRFVPWLLIRLCFDYNQRCRPGISLVSESLQALSRVSGPITRMPLCLVHSYSVVLQLMLNCFPMCGTSLGMTCVECMHAAPLDVPARVASGGSNLEIGPPSILGRRNISPKTSRMGIEPQITPLKIGSLAGAAGFSGL